MEDAGIINPMLKDLGIEMDCVRSYVSIGIEHEITHVESEDDLDGYTLLLKKFFPKNKDEINIIISRVMRDVICQHFFQNTPTFFALSYFSLYLDYTYPLGATGKLAADEILNS